MGRMMLTMMAGFAQFERDLNGRTTTQALAHKKANSQAYSPTPYGKNRDGERLLRTTTRTGHINKMRDS